MKLLPQVAVLALAICTTSFCSGQQSSSDMWLVDDAGGLGYVNIQTGAVTIVGDTGVVMSDIAFAPDGSLFGIRDVFATLYSIDPLTADATLIGNTGISGGNSLVFGTDGTLYGAGVNSKLTSMKLI